jgi:hypothetical protein
MAAVLEKPSDKAAMRLLGHMSLTRDPNAPYNLTSTQRQQVAKDPAVQDAKNRHAQSLASLRAKYKTISAARKQAKRNLKLQDVLRDHDDLQKQFKKFQARKESELLESLREDYFATLGTQCLENR